MSARVLFALVAMVCATALLVTWMVTSDDEEPRSPYGDPCLRMESC